jgi:hypothetical protein
MSNLTLYFHPENESIFRLYMTIAGVISTFMHILMLYMSTKFTPRSMTVYRQVSFKSLFKRSCCKINELRYTVKNTTTWSLILVIQTCFILRPIPYFPFYVAKADGPSFLVGSYWLATIQWSFFNYFHVKYLTLRI